MNGLTVLAPWSLALGVAVAATLVALHAITVGRPRPAWLPTARFAPDRAPRAERRLARPADRWLLAIRVAAALLAAAALARLVREPARRRVARVVLADVSSARAEVREKVRTVVGAGDALITFAATPRPAFIAPARPLATAADSAALRTGVDSALASTAEPIAATRPSLSAALIAARRIAPALAATADSIELLVVSPFARDAIDGATSAIRGTWAGRARMVAVGPPRDTTTARPPAGPATGHSTVTLRGAPTDDALAASLALAGVAQAGTAQAGTAQAGTAQAGTAPVRVLRTTPTPADRAWAAEPGHVLVVWPSSGAGTHGVEAIVVGDRAAVGAFGRVPVGENDRAPHGPVAPTAARTVARWADGAAAAIEVRDPAGGCVRTIGARVPQAGDAALRADFVALLPALVGPCGAARDSAPLAPTELALLAGAGPLLAAAPLRAPDSAHLPDPLGATLLALGALLLIAELPLRRVLHRPTLTSDAVEWGDAVRDHAADADGAAPRSPGGTARVAA